MKLKLYEARSALFFLFACAAFIFCDVQAVYAFSAPAAGATFEPFYQLLVSDMLNGAIGYSLGAVGLVFTLFCVGTGKIFPAIGAGTATAGLGIAPSIVTSFGAMIA